MENYRKSLIESIEDNKVELVAPIEGIYRWGSYLYERI
jgi:hypothetical protein